MRCNYIVKFKNRVYSFFHIPNSGVFFRTYENRWNQPVCAAADGTEFSAVSITDRLCMLSNSCSGEISLACGGEKGFAVKPLFSADAPDSFYTGFFSRKSSLFYSLGDTLFTKSFSNGVWSQQSPVDKFLPLPNFTPFCRHDISPEHAVIFYRRASQENLLGYREITPDRVGGFHAIFASAYPLYDFAPLTTKDGVFVLIAIKTMFSTRVIFRRKTGAEFSAPIVLCEGQRIHSCLLFIFEERLTAAFMSGDQLYLATSENMGETFEQPVKYKRKFCRFPIKAAFITDTPNTVFFTREVYVDSENVSDVQLFPDIYEDFYPVLIPPQVQNIDKEENTEQFHDKFSGMSFEGFLDFPVE
ncbi:MAG: hypothetical protein LBM16_00325 [Clostridiales bacterium]|jgi:hypothetical protein|nr:hypothetical protein [Clostridiales bacterium]